MAVVVPCYNGEDVLRATLLSLTSQSHPVDEIVVVDDGSRDNSSAVAESFGAPVRVVRQENGGAAQARYTGVEHAQSDIVVFNDAGDVSLPNRMEGLRRALIEHPECVASYGVTWIKSRERPVRSRLTGGPLDGSIHVVPNPLERMLARSWPLAIGMNLAVRRSVALKSARISPFYRAGNDYALQINTARYGPFAHVAEVSLEYEETNGGLSSKHGWTQQTGYALCAAAEYFEFDPDNRSRRDMFRRRVDADWPGIALHLYLRGNYPLLKRVVATGLKFGRLGHTPRRFWWALDKALDEGMLDGRLFAKGLARTLRLFRQTK